MMSDTQIANLLKSNLNLLRGLLIGALLVVSLSLSLPTQAATTKPTPVGRVVWVSGNLTAISPDNKIRKLERISLIYLHDTLVTDDRSQAQVVFTDNTLMTFRPGTKFYIDQYEYHPHKPSALGSIGKYVMNLIKGGFRTITGIIAKKNPKDYRVNTPVATIGVRGTDYSVILNENGQLYMSFYSGSPCVTSAGNAVCLNNINRYVQVPNAQTPPVIVQQQPAELKEKLPIVSATIGAPPSDASKGSEGATPTSGVKATEGNSLIIDKGFQSGDKSATNFCIQ